MIWLCSDWHFNHNKEFVYKVRGFDSIEEMNQAIIERHNELVSEDDDVYVLGDLMLGAIDSTNLIARMHGKLHIILGNHDSPNKIEKYKKLPNVVEIVYATSIRYRKYYFYLSHYPTLTANMDDEKSLHQKTINIFGHTHSTELFYENIPTMFNVAMEPHNCYPTSLDAAIEIIKSKFQESKTEV